MAPQEDGRKLHSQQKRDRGVSGASEQVLKYPSAAGFFREIFRLSTVFANLQPPCAAKRPKMTYGDWSSDGIQSSATCRMEARRVSKERPKPPPECCITKSARFVPQRKAQKQAKTDQARFLGGYRERPSLRAFLSGIAHSPHQARSVGEHENRSASPAP